MALPLNAAARGGLWSGASGGFSDDFVLSDNGTYWKIFRSVLAYIVSWKVDKFKS